VTGKRLLRVLTINWAQFVANNNKEGEG